jgi:hypothetical protein
MNTRRRTAVAAAALLAVALAGTASAASGAAPKPGPTNSATAGKPATADPDLVAAAAALGVTPDTLIAAIVGAKESFVGSTGPVTDDDFIAAVADRLGLPVSQVAAAVAPMIAAPGHGADKPGGQGKDGNDPANSPFATRVAAERFAASTGVSVEAARTALADLLQLAAGRGGLDTGSAGYAAIAHRLGLSTDQLTAALGQLKASFKNG